MNVDISNFGQVAACCGMLEIASMIHPHSEARFERSICSETDFGLSIPGSQNPLLDVLDKAMAMEPVSAHVGLDDFAPSHRMSRFVKTLEVPAEDPTANEIPEDVREIVLSRRPGYVTSWSQKKGKVAGFRVEVVSGGKEFRIEIDGKNNVKSDKPCMSVNKYSPLGFVENGRPCEAYIDWWGDWNPKLTMFAGQVSAPGIFETAWTICKRHQSYRDEIINNPFALSSIASRGKSDSKIRPDVQESASGFSFDCRQDLDRLTLGFSMNLYKEAGLVSDRDILNSPFLELMAAWGCQRFRPRKSEILKKDTVCSLLYSPWTVPLRAGEASIVFSGLMDDLGIAMSYETDVVSKGGDYNRVSRGNVATANDKWRCDQ